MSTVIPEKLINYNVYDDQEKLAGVQAEVTLPSFEAMSESISGAGIAGEYESPTIGHFGSQTMQMSFRVLNEAPFRLMRNQARTLTIRAAQQSYDKAAGRNLVRPFKVVVKGMAKGGELGTLAPGAQTNSNATIEVLYIKIELEGRTILEFDKLNYIYILDGVDVLADVRNAL
ncbi:phage major tail tube protein [Paenalkalicoccus suaedae]|uniref:Phage major tail tube protein n=1 Tax=Paenalkalicoccus suaedae TaxID=2592382 RepID=A0A859FDF9_9BACI|nr:phage major tail tube protein [Paenalkalicoccus suaedae]QKS70256.1 phage major tail tube protein [Paenalkalicoccus suaedae]